MEDNRSEMSSRRVQYYNFLSRMFEKELDTNLIAALKDMDLSADVEDKLTADGYKELKGFFDTDLENMEDELAAEYAKLFLAAGQAKGNAAFPYESVYTSKEHLMMQESWEDMVGRFAEKGIALSRAYADVKEDHIAAELKFMAYLCEHADLEDQAEFMEAHLGDWIAEFAENIEKYATLGFYRAVTKLLTGFLAMDKAYLAEAVKSEKTEEESYDLTVEEFDEVLAKLAKSNKVYAPVLIKSRSNANDIVRYKEVTSVKEIYLDAQSDFSAKEVYYPITQTMLYFSETEIMESSIADDKGFVLFLRPCDINAMRRLDNIFLNNGGNADTYYKRYRDRVKVILLECAQSGPNCFCVSMNSNIATDYSAAVRIRENGVKLQLKEPSFAEIPASARKCDFAPEFVKENERKVEAPVIEGVSELKLASNLSYWTKFDDDCIGCGGCNTVCPTCSCFDTIDVIYDETSREGERRRVWSSCMLDTFTMTAGGSRARATAGANMRFKALHKMYDYRKRFGDVENMCVGCGRCIKRCPKELDFANTINEFAQALDDARKEGK